MNSIFKRSITHLSQSIHQSIPESKVIALCKLGRLKEALHALPSDPFLLPSSTYSSFLQFCIDSNAKQDGRSLRNHLLANGYSPDYYLNTKFIIFYSKIGNLVAARKVFDEMPERTVVSWTAMISGYSQNGYLKEALEVFALMHRSGFEGNQFSYGSVLRVCTKLGCIRRGEQIQGHITKSVFAGNIFVQTALVDLHLKFGSVKDARSLFGRMEERDVVSWNSMISGYAVGGFRDDVFGLFCEMLRDGLLPDHFTLSGVLRACSLVKAIINVYQVHASVIKLGYESDCVVTGSLVDAYAKCRFMQSAKLVFDSIPEPDLVSCTALITGYSLDRSYSRDALVLFCEINRMGMRTDDIILCSVLNICANVAFLSFGRQIHAWTLKIQPKIDIALGNALIDMYAKSGELEDASHAFHEMQHKNVISWTSLITGYGKHGNGEGAITLFTKMEDNGVKPNDVTFLSLLFACSHSGLTSKGMEVFSSMVSKYSIHPRAEHFSCAVDLLARGGLLKEAYDFVNKMKVKPNISLWGAILGACRMHGNTSLGEVAARHLFSLDPERSVNHAVLANVYAAAGSWNDVWKTRKSLEEISSKKDAGWSSI